MKDTILFDVLVVYSDAAATSASSTIQDTERPFSRASGKANYNNVYSYFLKICEQKNIRAAFATSSDVVGSGKCKSYWTFKNNKWIKSNRPCYSKLIFDKFLPATKALKTTRTVMFSESKVKPFTNINLLNLFFDKFDTYSKLTNFSIPTVFVQDSTVKSVKRSLAELNTKIAGIDQEADFNDEVVLKDRFGFGGINVFKISKDYVKNIQNIMKKNNKVSFIIQPYVNFEHGYRFEDYKGATEIRLIYLNKNVVQTYVRVAGNKDFLCNHGKGGIQIKYKDVPSNVIESADKIVHMLNEEEALFALDFVISDENNVYLLEGNISPGIDWYNNFPRNERMNKEMIKVIVGELSSRAQRANSKN